MKCLDKEGGAAQGSLHWFYFWLLVAQGLELSAIILIGIWMNVFRGGYAWTEDPATEFNYHPVFMTIGMIVLYAEAILVYRVFRTQSKTGVKILHAVLHVLALVFTIVGLKAVFDSHNLVDPPVGNMYSLHSWIGLSAVLLFALQWVAGLLCFLFPGVRMDKRVAYKPLHVFWGLAIFVMAIAAALTGAMEKIVFVGGTDVIDAERGLSNMFGMVVLMLGLVVTYIVTNENFARPVPAEEQHIQLPE